jgi:glucokinase
LNLEKIVIGGGVSKAGDALLTIKEQFSCFAFPRVVQGVGLTIATLSNDAGVIGGAWIAEELFVNNRSKNIVNAI